MHSNGTATNAQTLREMQVRHLASLTSGFGQLTPEEGLQRLRQMAGSSAVSGTQCRLQLQAASGLRILDIGSGQLMEEFPLRSLRQPLAFEGGRDNLLLFSVQSETGWEMHIFQLPASVPANQVAKEIHQLITNGASPGSRTEGQPGLLVQVLNRCLEEVEAFTVHIQQQLPQEPATPRSRRSQSQPALPSVEQFVEVLKKLKLALNLLGRLEGRIHQPNAPELVHCLFVPLVMIVQALGTPDLPSRVLSPLLTPAAVDLMKHCLTSKESELWYSLGPAWTCHRQRWLDEHGGGKPEVPPYRPRFGREGWEPELEPELLGQGLSKSPAVPQPSAAVNGARNHSVGVKIINPVSVSQQYSPYANGGGVSSFQQQRLQQPQEPPAPRRPIAQVAPRGQLAPRAAPLLAPPSVRRNGGGVGVGVSSWDDRQERLRIEAAARGHRVVQAVHDKAGRNAKELTVQRGELLEVLDDSKNWWQLRNCVGEVGHAPYTILHVL